MCLKVFPFFFLVCFAQSHTTKEKNMIPRISWYFQGALLFLCNSHCDPGELKAADHESTVSILF